MISLLAIYGSAREQGNTDILLDCAIKGACSTGKIKVEKIYVRKLNISACRECHACSKTGRCIINDDMQQIYNYLEMAKIVIISSPVFFYGLPGHLKIFIDRTQCCWAKKYILKKTDDLNKKYGAFICTGATKGKNLFNGVRLTVKYFFDSFNIEYFRELLIRKVDAYQEIFNKPEFLNFAENLGREMVLFVNSCKK
ncbi:MAG: flavodoxin family protein [candidate division WOR-3 bacterium]